MPQLVPYTILLTLFFIFAWTRALNRYIKGEIGLAGFLVWTAVWGTGMYLVYLPNKADFVARLLGAPNGANAVYTLSVIILFYSVYRIYSKLEGQAREINRLNQSISIAHSHLHEKLEGRKRPSVPATKKSSKKTKLK